MKSYERVIKLGAGGQPDNREVPPIALEERELELNKADRIRGVVRSLVVDALAVLDKMRDDCQQPPALMENYYLLYHYLDYLKRFCDGKV